MIVVVFFFFKQKTAYELRISDWSSDVCSADLRDQEQHDSAGDTETVEADAERVEDIVPEQREDDQDQRRDADGAQRHRACVRRARPRRQPGIDRRAARRIDDDEKGDQRRDEQFGQCGDAHPSASVSYATPSRRHAETSVLRIRHANVIGPTPPGPGVIAPAWPPEPSGWEEQ